MLSDYERAQAETLGTLLAATRTLIDRCALMLEFSRRDVDFAFGGDAYKLDCARRYLAELAVEASKTEQALEAHQAVGSARIAEILEMCNRAPA